MLEPRIAQELDRWLTSSPDEDDTTACKCCSCGEPLYYDDEYWELDDQIYCEDCAQEWLDGHKNWVSARMVRGD